jgi:hypothetical protein
MLSWMAKLKLRLLLGIFMTTLLSLYIPARLPYCAGPRFTQEAVSFCVCCHVLGEVLFLRLSIWVDEIHFNNGC